MVRFNPGVGAVARERAASEAHVRLGRELPLVPNLWSGRTGGSVRTAVERLENDRDVDYAQPDYLVADTPEATPSQPDYYPNDPYFWSSKFTPAGACKTLGTTLSGGWPNWPSGANLTDPSDPATRFNLLDPFSGSRITKTDYTNFSTRPIDVMPVWNLLHDLGRAPVWQPEAEGGPGNWTELGLQRYGIGILDTGIADNPDVLGNVAAEFSTISLATAIGSTVIRQIYSDNPQRGDRALIRRHTSADVQNAERALFSLDDLQAANHSLFGRPLRPTGCDGHGTGVASVAGATIDNALGVAGVGYDPPLVGVRAGMPFDTAGNPNANNANIDKALAEWGPWHERVFNDVDAVLNRIAVVKALRLPVLNLSFGTALFAVAKDREGNKHPVLAQPTIAEAYADLLSTGDTLGVTAAGNDGERYGSGFRAIGAELTGENGVAAPCGLPLIPVLHVWKTPDPYASSSLTAGPYKPEPPVNYRRLLLICVGASTGGFSKLWPRSGNGSAAVQLLAPGVNVTVASRPPADPAQAYSVESGTSLSAPMVSGAASLLRRAAPGAPMASIQQALLRGARPMPANLSAVGYGNLDVACSLSWLYGHRKPAWQVADLPADASGYQDLQNNTAGCFAPPSATSVGLSVFKENLFVQGRRYDTMQGFVNSLQLSGAEGSNSQRWQEALTEGQATPWDNRIRAVFPIGSSGFTRPVKPPARPVYSFGRLTVGCPEAGYRITNLRTRFIGKTTPPQGWVVPTDAAPPFKQIQLAIAVVKPWYAFALPDTIKVEVDAICEFQRRQTT